MRIISRKALVEFWTKHPDAMQPLDRWYKAVEQASWDVPADVKETFRGVDFVKVGNRLSVIFNVKGNKYRVIAAIHFNLRKVYIRAVLTHAEYNAGKWRAKI